MLSVLQNTSAKRVMNAVAAGTSVQNSSGVDMSDADVVTFFAAFGVISASAVTNIKAQQSDDDGSSDDYTDIEGSLSVTMTPTTDNNKVLALEVIRPKKKWVRLVVNRATGNAVIDSVLALKSRLRVSPGVHDTTILGTEVLSGPNEGTA